LTAVGVKRGHADVTVREIAADGRLAEVTPRSVPVLLYGRVPSTAEAHAKIFDAAHAHGWKPPSHAIACWSFYPTKSLGALGDGGAITTNDADLAAEMRQLSGRDDRFYESRQITSRMDELQAAVLRVKLRYLDEWIADRRRIAARYALNLPESVAPIDRAESNFQHLFVVRSARRDALAAHLRDAGIETKVAFSDSAHRQPSFRWPINGAALF